MSFIKEFKEFAVKGNVIDMAVGIIIGAAFGKIISSVVSDVIMPPIGLMINGVDFKDLSYIIKEAVLGPNKEVLTPAVIISYGKFIQTIIDFTIIAFAVFILVRMLNSVKRNQEAAVVPPAPPAPTKEEILLTEIRDLLKNK